MMGTVLPVMSMHNELCSILNVLWICSVMWNFKGLLSVLAMVGESRGVLFSPYMVVCSPSLFTIMLMYLCLSQGGIHI